MHLTFFFFLLVAMKDLFFIFIDCLHGLLLAE